MRQPQPTSSRNPAGSKGGHLRSSGHSGRGDGLPSAVVFRWTDLDGMFIPVDLATGANEPDGFAGGRIERVDLATGESTVLYRECDSRRFTGPNDIVFDDDGGFYFTDFGKMRPHDFDRGGVYYARPDGSLVKEVAYGLLGPNGIGLAPDGSRLYVSESLTGRLLAWDIQERGSVKRQAGHGGACLVATPGHFDSLAVEANGTIVTLDSRARTNPQDLNLRSGVTVNEESNTVQVIQTAQPAVVTIVTRTGATAASAGASGSGFLVTSDGNLVTNVRVIANAQALTVLINGDAKPHDARVVDFDCETGVAVLKVDRVSNLKTLSFGDSNALKLGQSVVAVGGPLQGGAQRGIVSGLHKTIAVDDPVDGSRTDHLGDTLQTDTFIDASSSEPNRPLLCCVDSIALSWPVA